MKVRSCKEEFKAKEFSIILKALENWLDLSKMGKSTEKEFLFTQMGQNLKEFSMKV